MLAKIFLPFLLLFSSFTSLSKTEPYTGEPYTGKQNFPQKITLGSTNSADSLLFKQADIILSLAFKRLGYQLQLLSLPGKRSLRLANNGNIGGVAFRIQSLSQKDYPNLIMVNESLFAIEQSVFSQKNIQVNGWSSMRPYSIAYERGTQLIEQHKANFKQIIPVNSTEQALLLVLFDRADLTITSRQTGLQILTDQIAMFANKVHVVEPAIVNIELFTFLHNKYQYLVPLLKNELTKMKNNGEFELLLKIEQTETMHE